MHNYRGKFYDEVRYLPFDDTVRRIKADIKQKLPDTKTSIRVDQRHRLVPSIRVTAYGVSKGRQSIVYRQLERITRSYNYDNSDVMTDYFECGFYAEISFA